jgi:hypothetical protein
LLSEALSGINLQCIMPYQSKGLPTSPSLSNDTARNLWLFATTKTVYVRGRETFFCNGQLGEA